MKDLVRNIPIATILLTYLFICGSLYLLGFWSTFNVDIFSLISLYDIPKNFVFPLMVTQGFFLINVLSTNFVDLNPDRVSNEYLIKIKDSWPNWKKFLLSLLTSVRIIICSILILLAYIEGDFLKSPNFWSLSSIIIAYFFLYRFVNHSEPKKYIKSGIIRYYLAHLLIFFPIVSFSTGKVLSLKIYNNTKPTMIEVPSKDSSPAKLKFLGFISETYIYSSIDNQTIYIQEKFSDSKVKLIYSK